MAFRLQFSYAFLIWLALAITFLLIQMFGFESLKTSSFTKFLLLIVLAGGLSFTIAYVAVKKAPIAYVTLILFMIAVVYYINSFRSPSDYDQPVLWGIFGIFALLHLIQFIMYDSSELN